MRSDVIVKVARCLLLIRGRQVLPDLDLMAVEMECSPRTVRRYLDALSVAGWPVPPLPREAAGDEW